MNATNLQTTKAKRARTWFRKHRRSHNPMLVLNMSNFNSGSSWDRIFNAVLHRENVWC